MREEYMSSQEIRHEIADLKIRLVLQEQFEQETAGIIEETNAPDAGQTQTMRELEEKVLHDIAQQTAPSPKHRSSRFPKSLRILTAVLILLLVSMSSAYATVHMIRVGLLKLDVQNDQERTSYGLTTSGETMDVPDGWTGSFYPAYIPDGFMLVDCEASEAEFKNADQDTLSFGEYTYGARVSIDTENAEITITQVNGIDATLIEKEDWSAAVWSANNRLFVIEMDGSAEEVLTIAESVTLTP